MIYVASLAGFGKKTFGDKTLQTKMNKITQQLDMNPKITGMDLVVLGPKDLSILHVRNSFETALQKKHKDILVLYLYTNEKQGQYVQSKNVITKKIDKKINLRTFKEAVTEFLENKTLTKKEDRIAPIKITMAKQDKVKPLKNLNDNKSPNLKLIKQKDIPSCEKCMDETLEVVHIHKAKTLEERIKECTQFSDWNLFKKLLTKDTIVNDLMYENSQFAETINMLRTLDKQMIDIFKDTSQSAEQKFETIRSLGIKRSGYKATQNNIMAEKINSILTTMTISTESIIHSRLKEITSALDKFASTSTIYYKQDKDVLEALIKDRLQLQFELHELSKDLITIYQSMDETVKDIVASFDNGLPSDNTYINDVYKPSKKIFTPINTAQLAAKLMSDLQKNRISLSALEKNIQEVISKVFQLCELDESIIIHQNKLIKLLEANNVEDVVIVDTILKNALRLYIGPYDVGTRSTTITWAGILSRRHNSLLIDLTGSSKYRAYGIEPVTLEDFLNNRIEEPFLCVEGDLLQATAKIDDIVAELKTRLNYYPFINILLEPSQASLIQKLADHALSVTYITDCTPRGNALLKHAIQDLTLQNIAKKIVLIDPPTEEMVILNDLSIDPFATKLITLPHLSKMKAYCLKGLPPFNDREIVTIFEEAFR